MLCDLVRLRGSAILISSWNVGVLEWKLTGTKVSDMNALDEDFP